jgi:2-amino-4-hydroxy-6-hydroxymethyldihydropteridine diphosphokinase
LIKEQLKKAEIGVVIKQDMSENRVNLVYLGIGSNLGNRKKNIEKAKIKLLQNNINILETSSYYESPSWPNKNNPKYLNIVIKINTNFEPLKLLCICKEIEFILGRRASPKNSPRLCDIDILDYENITTNNGINLPHPRISKRNFVLFPLFEISKYWKHPVLKHNIKRLILSLSNKDISSIKQI